MEEAVKSSENKTTTKPSTTKLYIIFGSSIVLLCVIIYFMATNNSQLTQKYEYEKSVNENLKINKDSLQKTNVQLSSYQPLTSAMIQRDDIRRNMEYHPGDFLIMKVDSSRVLVVDIIIGGDTYNYTLHYLVQHKDKKYEEVSPQLVYPKKKE
ncbi:MAG: hypothetical protein WCL02_07550 [bacterium]